MTLDYNQKVGNIIRIEWDKETDEVRIIIDITNKSFKQRVLHNKDFQDVLTIRGKDAIVVASQKV